MRERTAVGDVTRDYCIKYPSAPSIQLARMLRRDHPALFATVEVARTSVRRYRGKNGVLSRQHAEHTKSIVERIAIPTPEPPSFQTFTLGDDVKRWLILADLHVPFHAPEAIELALSWATRKQTRCDGVLLLGDFADFYQVSNWLRDPRRRKFKEELEACGQMLDVIRQRVKPKRIVWRASNHEYRMDRYLMAHAPELFGIPQFTVPSFMELERRGVEWIPRGCPIQHHALNLLHGDEWRSGMSTPVSAARTAYLKARECVIIGHFHRTHVNTEPSLRGMMVTSWSVGCLCDLHPEYAPLTAWNWGFATLTTGEHWRVENLRIVQGEVL